MLDHISWSGYWTVVGLLTVGYYLGVYLIYFRSDFEILGRFKSPAFHLKPSGHGGTELEGSQLSSCLDEVDAYFAGLPPEEVTDQEITESHVGILRKYELSDEAQDRVRKYFLRKADQYRAARR